MFTGAGTVVLVGVFGPWLRSGSSTRSSFELLDLVERLGFAPDGPFGVAVRGWPLVPLLVVAATVACWAGRTTASVRLGFIGGLYVAGVAYGVRNAPDVGLVRTEWATDLSFVAGLGLVLITGWVAATASSGRPDLALDEDIA